METAIEQRVADTTHKVRAFYRRPLSEGLETATGRANSLVNFARPGSREYALRSTRRRIDMLHGASTAAVPPLASYQQSRV
jgi:hypothetical protein